MKVILLNLIIFLLPLILFAQQESKNYNDLLLDYYQNQRFAEAADFLIKNNPEPINNQKTLAALAYSSQMAGRLSIAEGYYERIYASDSTNNAIIYKLGNINLKRGNNSKALEYFKKIISRDSNNFNVYKQMAFIAEQKSDILNQLLNLKKANKINPTETDVAYDLTNIYIRFNQYNNADSVITNALSADTNNFSLLDGKIQVDYHLKKYEETIRECNIMLNAGEQSTRIINYLGESYFNLKKYTECINSLKTLDSNNTATETSFYFMAMSYKALKNMKMAIIYFEKAISAAISGNVKSYYGEIADSFNQIKLPAEALSNYKKSLLYGELPLTYYEIANIYDIDLHNKTLAINYFKKFVNSNPTPDKKAYLKYAKQRINELTRH